MGRPHIATRYEEFRMVGATSLREAIRLGHYRGHTAGLADGKLQADVIILPNSLADDFLDYCMRNPKSLPLVGVNRAGDPSLPTLGEIDVRTDLPQYDVFHAGPQTWSRTDIISLWRDDLVAFALGGTFSFEHMLRQNRIEVRHVAMSQNVPLYRSSIRTQSVGVFGGYMVVSMRPIRKDLVDRARAMTARFPHAHGSPVHVGDPVEIGIDDLDSPDWGDAVDIHPDEIPVFWASGLTAQSVLKCSTPEMFITNTPGHMLITDLDADADVGQIRLF